MLILPASVLLPAVILAFLVDALVGDPPALWRRLPHPVVLMGRLLARGEAWLRRPEDDARAELLKGAALLAILLAVAIGAAIALQALLLALPFGAVLLGLAMSTLIAARSLADHVGAVADGLEEGLEAGRRKVALIVGRDPSRLDRGGVARAAIESLAENFADGVIAPLFWTLLLGLPGLVAYKAINTADSMIGHRNARYHAFGRCAARADDLANLLPARLTALILLLARPSRLREGLAVTLRDARRHRSPNAGWPEAALAGLLGFRLSGPRAYDGQMRLEPWIGNGRTQLGPADIRKALGLVNHAWWLVTATILATAIAVLVA